MAVEIFSKEYFEKVLEDSHSIESCKLIGNEFRYTIQVSDGVFIFVNSSVEGNGMSAETNANSIRAWIGEEGGRPLGSKTQSYVTRVEGWEERMLTMLEELEWRASQISFCNECSSFKKVFRVKKDGKNKGRLFLKCNCDNSFRWLTDAKGNKMGDKAINPHSPPKNVPGTSSEPEKHSREELTTEFQPSQYQKDIFAWIDETIKNGGNKSLVIEALAGTGKTTTGVQFLHRIPSYLDVLMVAFNKHIAEELSQRVPGNVMVKTYHALGFAACRQAFGSKIKMDNSKVFKLFKQTVDYDMHRHLYPIVRNIVSLVKAHLLGVSDEDLTWLVEHHGIELNGDSALIFDIVRAVISKAAEMTNVIDYDDMCWLPIYHNLPMREYDVLFIDECQDTNKNQIALALTSIKDTGIIVAAGDRYQSLYGFRGADAQAVPNLISELDADTLPLSITYRNPRCVVELVNQTFPHIPLEVWENASEGRIAHEREDVALSAMKDGDMVLCRTNAPMVRPVFELIRRKKKATIRGRDIGKNLMDLVEKILSDTFGDVDTISLTTVMQVLKRYKDEEVSKLLVAGKTAQAQTLEDKAETLVALSDGIRTVGELRVRIDEIFSDEIDGIVFSTVHRAKGLEAPSVYILRQDLMPHPYAKQPWELEQEANIEYVAYTRSQGELIFVM